MGHEMHRQFGGDVTPQILQTDLIYGGSEHNTPWTYAASANLHYVSGPTIQRAHKVEVAAIPFVQK